MFLCAAACVMGFCFSNFGGVCWGCAHRHVTKLEWHLPLLNFTLGWPTIGPATLGSQKVCYLGMAPSPSKFYPREDPTSYMLSSGPFLLYFLSGGSQKGCYIGVAPTSSKLDPQVARKLLALT